MTTVRLDPTTRRIIDRLAERRGQTRAEVIRDAIELLAGEEDCGKLSAFDRLEPFLGIADSGVRQLSRESGRRFRRTLRGR